MVNGTNSFPVGTTQLRTNVILILLHVHTMYNYSVYDDSLQLIIIQGMWQIFRGIFIWFLTSELRIFRQLILRKDTELFQTYSNINFSFFH